MSPAPYLCRKILKGPRRMDIPVRLWKANARIVSRSKSRGAGQIFILRIESYLRSYDSRPQS